MIGKTIAHYRIEEKLGAGGMGEVYRAHDTRLGRDVAIKVLPDAFLRDPERLARFEREAQVLAALNHANVAAIHGVEESDGARFLVLEFVPGRTLAERLVAGPLPVEEALEICRQMAEALEAAHERGIIHRDLKPSNVKVTPEGKVKVLDFGLAKAFGPEAAAADLSHSPTATYRTGGEGAILGTAAYMSPEQARGKALDRRTDIWSFGCVLYELLSSRQAFGGETVTDTLAAVVRGEPDWNVLPAEVPAKIRYLLRRCLERDLKRRLQAIGEARIAIEEGLSGSAAAEAVPVAPLGWQRALPWALVGALVAALLASLWVLRQASQRVPAPVLRSAVTVPAGEFSTRGFGPWLALSPDGTHLVYEGFRGGTWLLFLRPMDQYQAVPLSGTEGATGPFFSADGQWVGFFVDGKLKKVSIQGGAPLTLCDVPDARGATWTPDDTIIFTPTANSSLWRVAASGGTPQPLTTLDTKKGENSHRWPDILPGGKAVLFVESGSGVSGVGEIAVLSLKTGKRRTLVELGMNPHYVPSGHLVYGQAGSLLAVPFDLDRLEVTGSPVPVLEDVDMDNSTGAVDFSPSAKGSLIYVLGGGLGAAYSALVWVDRKGAERPIAAPPNPFGQPRLSPDGRRVAVNILGQNSDIWIYELARGALTRMTFQPGEDETPAWTSDGKRVAFSSSISGKPRTVFWKNADGSGSDEPLLDSGYHTHLGSFSLDGRVLAYTDYGSVGRGDIWVLPLEGDRKPRPFLQTPFNERDPKFSPDGHWIAYTSDESGRDEVYVQPFPGPGGKWQVSTEGGYGPVWARNGRELFYRNADKMMVVAVSTKPTFSAGPPRLLFEGSYTNSSRREANYDISPDGERFLMVKAAETHRAPTELYLVVNWFEELKRRVPAGRTR